MQPDKRNYLIDLLRIIAASWVVLFHFSVSATDKHTWYYSFCTHGYLGVPMFFMISGYCILIALQHAKKPSEFIVRRFFRIFPPYWFSLVLVCAIIIVLKILTGANSVATLPKTIAAISATICLLTTPVTNVIGINWVYWTLSYEVFFYVVIYGCSIFKNQYFTIALLAITILSLVLPVHKSGPLFFLGYWPLFSLGLAIFQLLHYPARQKWLSVILLVLSIAGFYTTHQANNYSLVCFITALLIVGNHFFSLKNNSISRLGDVSYSLYLIHVPVGIYLFNLVKTPAIKANLSYCIPFDLVLLALLIILSKLMHRHIEVPAINYGKRFGHRPKVITRLIDDPLIRQ